MSCCFCLRTTQPAPHLDGKHVVFGRVVGGEEVVVAVEELPVDNRHRPLNSVAIQRCGQLLARSKPRDKKKAKKKAVSSDSESDSEVEEKKRKKKKKKKEKKKKKSKKNKKAKREVGAPQSRGPSKAEAEAPDRRRTPREEVVRGEDRRGRDPRKKVKGRGAVRYMPPATRSRTPTPPHWRQEQRRTVPFEIHQRRTERLQEREAEL
ncbi:Cyclophilin-type peptidyl-prolyl cis-trans isomerase domain, partial [Trinorchestia longiramus]